MAVSVDHHLTSGDQFRPCFGIPVIHRRPAKECPYEQQLNHTSSSQEIATEHPHRPVDPPRRASPPAAQRKGRQVAATVVPAHGDRPAFAQHDPVVGPDGVVLHDWHHNAQLGTTFPTSRRRLAATAAHSNTTRPRAARTMRIGTTGPRNARKFAPMHAQSPLAPCSCMRLTCTITRAQFACAQVTSDAPAPLALIAARQAATTAQPTTTHADHSCPPWGRALNTRGATALSRRPLPIPAGLLRRESLLACQGSTGAGEERGTGGSDACSASAGDGKGAATPDSRGGRPVLPAFGCRQPAYP